MLMFPRKSSFMLAAAASVIALSLAAGCQAPQPAATAAPASVQLQPYTAPDQSASAGVPSGWQVTSGQQTVIAMTGPGGAALTLGNTIVAQNAAFQPGKKGANGADLSMPYTATLAQKFTMIIQQGAAVSGKPTPQVIITSSTPIQLPPAVGECARFVASVSGEQGSMKLLAVLCSLRLDSGGAYKNISLMAQAPVAVADQAAPTAQAVFQSYRIPATWLQKKLAPFNAPPAASSAADMKQANAIMQSTMAGEAAANNSANCFDLSVLRGTPTALLPRSCGGNAP
jgi:hypothetical protein